MPEDKRRRGDGPALVDGRGDGPDQDAVQHGGDLVRIRGGGVDERVERPETGTRQARCGPGEQAHDRPAVVRLEQERHEREGGRRDRPLEHRHLQHQAADPLRRLHGGEQAHVSTQRDPAEHRLADAELIKQAQHLLGVEIHPIGPGVAGLVATAVTQQVEQHDAVAVGGQPPGQAAAEIGVQQQAVQPHQHPVSRAVHLIRQPVLTVIERVPHAIGRGYRPAGG